MEASLGQSKGEDPRLEQDLRFWGSSPFSGLNFNFCETVGSFFLYSFKNIYLLIMLLQLSHFPLHSTPSHPPPPSHLPPL